MQLRVEPARILSFSCANRPENFLCFHRYLFNPAALLVSGPFLPPRDYPVTNPEYRRKPSRSVLFSELRDFADENDCNEAAIQHFSRNPISDCAISGPAGLWRHQAIHQPIRYFVRRLHGTYINIQEHTLLGKPLSLRVATSLRLHEEGGQRRVPPPEGALVASRPPLACRTAL